MQTNHINKACAVRSTNNQFVMANISAQKMIYNISVWYFAFMIPVLCYLYLLFYDINGYKQHSTKSVIFLKIFLPVIFLILSCNRGTYKIVEAHNPKNFQNTIFGASEDISAAKFSALKERYSLDTIFHGEKDELKRILLLRHWIHHTMKIGDYGPYTGNGSAENTLDEALGGHGFHCGYFSSVQNAILNAYGYVTRSILADTGEPVDYMVGGGHHALNEVWLNSYHKWVLIDAKYDYHFEKNDIPLSALEVRAAYLKNKASDIDLAIGVDKKIVAGMPEYNIPTREDLAKVYTWISWYKDNDRYTYWPESSADIIIYRDEYTKSHTWLWVGKPLWAYNTKYLHWTDNISEIEWTPNTISSGISISGNKLKINLNSSTPNLKTYQIKSGNHWEDITNNFEATLKHKKYEWSFRTMNIAVVDGIEYKIIIAK